MPNSPSFSYYISPSEKPLSAADSVWSDPLPMARPSSGKSLKPIVTHGNYFEVVRSFIEQDGFGLLSGIIAKRLHRAVSRGDISDIRIHLEKHGEFYHPARIEVDVTDQPIGFVLNTAVSVPGKELIDGEFHNLKRLYEEFSESFLPEVYAIGRTTIAGGKRYRMFLGEWLYGYHEFHISTETSGDSRLVCVWDDCNGRYFLSQEQMLRIYRQAAVILTYYYNITTFEHISQWHHAAGDFILKQVGDNIDLKLITVRRYSSLFQNATNPASGAEEILQALLIFFLKLSFRMRLDRTDGIGELVWSDPGVVRATLDGVLDGLSKKSANSHLPDAVDTCFIYYLTDFSPADLHDLSDSILQTFVPEAPETHLIKQNLGEHVHLLHQAIEHLRPE